MLRSNQEKGANHHIFWKLTQNNASKPQIYNLETPQLPNLKTSKLRNYPTTKLSN